MKVRSFRRGAVLALVLAVASPVRGQRWFDPPPPTSTPAPGSVPAAPTTTPGPACAIDVFEHEPAVPFDLIAVVEVQARSPRGDPDDLLFSARVRACELGGDALVVLWRRQEPRSGMAPSPGGHGLLSEPGLRAAVLRYR